LTRQLARLTPSPQLRVARLILKRITEIVREERELYAELTLLLKAHAPAAARAARMRDGHRRNHHRPHRRRTTIPLRRALRPSRRAAPIPASSGNTQRQRPHRGGDRQLNRAIHIIAISRAKTDPETRAYLARKHAEGKSKLEAICCLKRHPARRIWRLLSAPRPRPAPAVLINRSNPQIPTFT
jgi:hypothetical protein